MLTPWRRTASWVMAPHLPHLQPSRLSLTHHHRNGYHASRKSSNNGPATFALYRTLPRERITQLIRLSTCSTFGLDTWGFSQRFHRYDTAPAAHLENTCYLPFTPKENVAHCQKKCETLSYQKRVLDIFFVTTQEGLFTIC